MFAEERIDNSDIGILDNAWNGAEAFHFYMLAHQQLYNRQIHEAVCTLYRLQHYTSYISPVEVYSLLALAAYIDGAYGLCSKMFVRLDSLKTVRSHI